ncbi:M-phase inducer phosphatase 2-like isoform X2 [Anopheles albimanus]|uniref:M-phase inducer phosphatase 2-like isoform X2 n=1 Tax=Anopheles albimanus TaxID=7167 RepID=UPI0007D5F595|nr:M-phase inducer phosphatase 2-like isoform X2 [Anopheles albimanus]
MFIDENLDFDIVECTSRFTLNSAGRSPATRRAEQRQRSVQRRARANPLRMMIHDDGKLFGSPSKEALPSEELSFYQSHSPQQSPRPCSPCTICPEEDALMGELLPSESNTPSKHQPIPLVTVAGEVGRSTTIHTASSSSSSTITSAAVSTSGTGAGSGHLGYNRVRRPLEDHDTNSMDSGYGASVLNEGVVLGSSLSGTAAGVSATSLLKGSHSMFRFATSSSSGSMSRHNSSSPSSRRLLSSLSSGSMESMDDLELFDMEAMQDEELCGGRLQQQASNADKQLQQSQRQHLLHPHYQQQSSSDQQQPPEGGMLLPSGLNSLICGTIKTTKTMTTPELKRPFVRRCLSLTENTNNKLNMQSGSPAAAAAAGASPIVGTPMQMKTPERFGRRLIAIEDQENCNLTPFSSRPTEMARCFKRPEPPGVSPVQSKRCKTIDGSPKTTVSLAISVLDSPSRTTVPVVLKKPVYQKSISMNDAQIMSALSRSSSEPDLIGDFSKSYVLPLMEGQHRDLKSISGDTMARLLRGEFCDKVASYKIIDCRYPYEFEGGHIRGAKNLYTQEQIIEELINSKTEPPVADGQDGSGATVRRNIIVFHCEFSSERGPKLSRFLRNHDRILNSDSYPALHYPEIYLLHGGYKEFFKAHASLCDPIAYRPMLDPEFGEAYRHFRAKSRSWNGDGSTCTVKATKTRSRLVL